MMRFLAFLPVIVLLIVLSVLAKVLVEEPKQSLHTETGDKQRITSLPEIHLPSLEKEGEFLTHNDIKGSYALVNVFASWCVSCLIEHPLLLKIKASRPNIRIIGIAWNDPPEATRQWLKKHGNPYHKIGIDQEGTAIFDLGVSGAPETFIVDPKGIILGHYKGPMTEQGWNEHVAPILP